jgi:hypothetical protein
MASSWMGCRQNIMNSPSWYVTVLWWLWLVFPWILPLVKQWGGKWPWCQMLVINIAAGSLIILMFPLGVWTYQTFPALRFFEFLIGCIAASINTRLHWVWPAAVALFMTVFYINQYVMLHRTTQCPDGGHDIDCMTCNNLWSFMATNPFTDTCLLFWSYSYINKFALLWAVLIHWLATSELQNIRNRPFEFLEQSQLMRTLSTFSLQLYLGHTPMYYLLYQVSVWLYLDSEWEFNLVFIAVYWACYGVKVWVQPFLDKSMEALGSCWTKWVNHSACRNEIISNDLLSSSHECSA